MLCTSLLAALLHVGLGLCTQSVCQYHGTVFLQMPSKQNDSYLDKPSKQGCILKGLPYPDYDIPSDHPPQAALFRRRFPNAIHLQDVLRRIYYINMDRSPDRKAYMEEMLTGVQTATGVPFERVRALEPDQDRWVQQKLSMQNDFRRKMWGAKIIGEVSVHSNHLRAWRHALYEATKDAGLNQFENFVMVLEDDALVDLDLLNKLPTALATVPADVQMLLLGWWGEPRAKDSINIHQTVYRVGGRKDRKTGFMRMIYGGMHAYLLRISDLQHLVDFMEEAPWGYSTDGGTLFHPACLRKYAVNPPLVLLNTSNSHKSVRLAVNKESHN